MARGYDEPGYAAIKRENMPEGSGPPAPGAQSLTDVRERGGGMNLSHRQALILAGVVGILLLRNTSKLGKAWGALWGAKTDTSPLASAPAGSGGTASGASGAGSTPGGASSGPGVGGSPFGLSDVTGVVHPTAWLAQDRGLVPDATGEINYLLPAGSQDPFVLPPGTQWTLLSQGFVNGVGGEEEWESTDGGLLGFLHLSQLAPTAPGNTEPGGSVAGVTGWPQAAAYAVRGITGPQNAHLAVVYDSKSQGYVPYA